MDEIMRDSAADAGGQPVGPRTRALLDADSRGVEVESDAGNGVGGNGDAGIGDGEAAPVRARDRRELEALLRSRGRNDMSELDPNRNEAEPDEEPVPPADLAAGSVETPLGGVELTGGEPAEGEPTEAEVPTPTESTIDAAEAAAALAAAEDQLEIDESSIEEGEDGLPPVPELADAEAVARIVFVLLLSQREGLSLFRLAQACNTTQKLVEAALPALQQQIDAMQMPLEVSRAGESVRLLSRPDAFPFLQRLRGVKKMEKLSPAALETLAVIAYRQPVMRAEIEAIRGVKAGPMLRTLLQHKLVRVTGRADVPGRPLQYGTTEHFLERFGLSSLQELPSVKEWKALG